MMMNTSLRQTGNESDNYAREKAENFKLLINTYLEPLYHTYFIAKWNLATKNRWISTDAIGNFMTTNYDQKLLMRKTWNWPRRFGRWLKSDQRRIMVGITGEVAQRSSKRNDKYHYLPIWRNHGCCKSTNWNEKVNPYIQNRAWKCQNISRSNVHYAVEYIKSSTPRSQLKWLQSDCVFYRLSGDSEYRKAAEEISLSGLPKHLYTLYERIMEVEAAEKANISTLTHPQPKDRSGNTIKIIHAEGEERNYGVEVVLNCDKNIDGYDTYCQNGVWSTVKKLQMRAKGTQ